MSIKHIDDFIEESNKLVDLTISEAQSNGFDIIIPIKVRLLIMCKLYDKWLEGYNDGFLDSTKKVQHG